MILHAPLALLVALFAYSVTLASPEALGPRADEAVVSLTFAALR